jgi:hypothetical protein
MGIKHIAAAMIAPAAVVGVAFSGGISASAATIHQDASTHSTFVSQKAAARSVARHDDQAKYHRWITVHTGDTLSHLASAHHLTWQEIFATYPNTHKLHNPDMITTGERLRLPADPKARAADFTALVRHGRGPVKPAPAPAATSAPAPTTTAPTATQSSGSVSGAGESSFEQCVSLRESGNNPTDPDGLFGILPSTWASLGYSGSAGEASVAQQKEAFNRLYAEDGTSPWAPYDGC